MIKPIELKSTRDVENINKMAARFECDVYVHSKDAMVDAKSLLGLMAMVGRSDLNLVFPDHLPYGIVAKELKKAKL